MKRRLENDPDGKAPAPPTPPLPITQRQLVILSLLRRPEADERPSRP